MNARIASVVPVLVIKQESCNLLATENQGFRLQLSSIYFIGGIKQ